MKIPEKRIGNIGYRHYNGGEIVQYYPNPFYGKKHEYQWDEGRQMYYKERGAYFHPNCFKHKENCYTLAFTEESGYGFCLKTVGLEMFDLKGQDKEDFENLIDWMRHNMVDDE